jgi:hypothetical protein
MSEICWYHVPEDAEFYADGYFRKNVSDHVEFLDDIGGWRISAYSFAELASAPDFELRPVCTPEATPDVTTEDDSSKWTAVHYDNYYQLTEADIKAGKVKIDAYFVNKMWKLNQKDDTGGLFHSLKTIARFGEKNTIERELKALYNQTKRMAELYGVKL